MVEYAYNLDDLFGSLSDRTRRDILQRLSEGAMTVGAIARNYGMSLSAVAKHLTVLEKAHLVYKTRRGTEQVVTLEPEALFMAKEYLDLYREQWEDRLKQLDVYLDSIEHEKNTK